MKQDRHIEYLNNQDDDGPPVVGIAIIAMFCWLCGFGTAYLIWGVGW